MESLMLLGGQFLQARIRDEHRRDPVATANRERAYWKTFGEPECGAASVYRVAARLLAAFAVLGVLFAGLAAAAATESGTKPVACSACLASPSDQKPQPSFTPFRLAM